VKVQPSNKPSRLLLPIRDIAVVEGPGILDRAKNVTKRWGLSSGFETLDNYLRGGGFTKGLTYIVGGRPGMGKTNVLLNMARNVAAEGNPIAIFSLELTKERVLERLAYMEAGIDLMYHWREKVDLSSEEIQKLTSAIQRLQKLPIHVRDSTRLTATDVRITLEREAELGIKLFLIDYLHIMGTETNTFNRERQIGTTIESVRDNAKNLNIPCVIACQLNRQVEEAAPFIPALKDFRDSGTIEQVAFMVLALYRRDYYYLQGLLGEDEGIVGVDNTLDMLILKNQDGPTGTATLKFDAATGRINDL
jgi:replicative DNA helicase